VPAGKNHVFIAFEPPSAVQRSQPDPGADRETITMIQLLAALLLSASPAVAAFGTTALAQQPVRPLPKVGSCPLGYYSSGGYCVPSSGGNTRGAIEKVGGSCPLGFYSSGNYCLSSSGNDREAIQKTGKGCPLGWFSSGSYCIKSR
jgi:hypothetical protein